MTADDKYLIERQYDDLLVSEGEILFEKNAVIDFSQPEKQLYVFVVHDVEDHETEIFKPFTKVQKSTCTCTFFKRHQICRHVLAALFFIRNLKTAGKKTKTEVVKNKVQTLNTHTLLQNADREDLIRFVKQYARDNAAFALQLKIHFARTVDMADNKDKYKMILDSIIKPYTGKTKPNLHVLKAFLSVSDEFLGQVEDCLALEQYQEALNILETVMYKFLYVRHHYGMDSVLFSAQNKAWHDAAASFFRKNLPFQLKKQLIGFLTELTFLSFYRIQDVISNTIFLLSPVLKGKQKTEFIKKLEVHLSGLQTDEKLIVQALLCFLSDKIPDSVSKHMFTPGFLWIPFLEHLKTAGILHLAASALQKHVVTQGKKNKELYGFLFEIHLERQQWDEALEVALMSFLDFGEVKYVTAFKSTVGSENWEKSFGKKTEKWLASKPGIDQKTMTNFYYSIKDYPKLWEYIRFFENVELLSMYDHELYPEYASEVERMYQTLIEKYFENHHGELSFGYIGSLCKHFDSVKLTVLKKNILRFILKTYPDRSGLKQYVTDLN